MCESFACDFGSVSSACYESADSSPFVNLLYVPLLLSHIGPSNSIFCLSGDQDIADAPDYYDIIKNPLCLEQMLEKVDTGKYSTLPVW